MYRPTNKTRQRGGQYVENASEFSTILLMPYVTFSTFSTMGVSESVLSTLEGQAGLKPNQDITNLEVAQLESLIRAIDAQIASDNKLIGEKNLEIFQLGEDINKVPGGLQEQYNIADRSYQDAKRILDTAAKTYSTNRSTYIGKQLELAELGNQSSITKSSIYGYEDQYNRILGEIPQALAEYNNYSSLYGHQLVEFNNYINNYSTNVYNFNSTIQALTYNSTLFSVATYQYISAGILYSTLNADYSTYIMTSVFPANFQLRSTQSYYSSIVYRIDIQQRNLNSTIDSLELAKMDLAIAQARKACEVAVAREVSTIVMFSYAETNKETIDTLLLRDPNNATLKQQKVSADTTYATLSSMARSAIQDRLITCTHQSTINQIILESTLSYYDSRISTAAMYLADAKYREACAVSTINSISSNVSRTLVLEGQVISTMSSFSTLYIREISEFNYYSTIVGGYDLNAFNLSTQLISTLSMLHYYINFSTAYSFSTSYYKENYKYYSTLEGGINEQILSYLRQRTDITSSIDGLGVEIADLDQAIRSELLNLATNGPNFYTYKTAEMNDEIDEYKYTISEISATVGMTVAELVIRKMNNIDIITRKNFRLTLQSHVLTNEDQQGLLNDISQMTGENSQIDRLLMRLNPLEIRFRKLGGLVDDERSLKTGTGGFIQKKRELFNDEFDYYESNRDPAKLSEKIAAGYDTRFADMNQIVNNIAAKITARDNEYRDIKEVLQDSNVRDSIYTILGGQQRFPDTENGQFVGLIITADTTPILPEERNPETLSEYSIVPTLPN